jgi:hypothetical protein
MESITINDFKTGRYEIVASDETTGEVYTAIPEKAIADIASQFMISNERALQMLNQQWIKQEPEIVCPSKNARFWVEEKEK